MSFSKRFAKGEDLLAGVSLICLITSFAFFGHSVSQFVNTEKVSFSKFKIQKNINKMDGLEKMTQTEKISSHTFDIVEEIRQLDNSLSLSFQTRLTKEFKSYKRKTRENYIALDHQNYFAKSASTPLPILKLRDDHIISSLVKIERKKITARRVNHVSWSKIFNSEFVRLSIHKKNYLKNKVVDLKIQKDEEFSDSDKGMIQDTLQSSMKRSKLMASTQKIIHSEYSNNERNPFLEKKVKLSSIVDRAINREIIKPTKIIPSKKRSTVKAKTKKVKHKRVKVVYDLDTIPLDVNFKTKSDYSKVKNKRPAVTTQKAVSFLDSVPLSIDYDKDMTTKTSAPKNDYSKFKNTKTVKPSKSPLTLAAASQSAPSNIKSGLDHLPTEIQQVIQNKLLSPRNADVVKKASDSSMIITATVAKFNKGLQEQVKDFQFIPSYDMNASYYDYGLGEIKIEMKQNSDLATVRGTFGKEGLVPTIVDLAMDKKDRSVDVPLIEEDDFNKYLDKLKIRGLGGHLLLELNDNVDYVEIDHQHYEAMLYLNDSLKDVGIDGDYHFVLYMGIAPGNIQVRFLLDDGEVAQKEIHIRDRYLSYDLSFFENTKLSYMNLYNRSLLSIKPGELSLRTFDMNYVDVDVEFNKVGTNRYEFQAPSVPLGTRHYLELGETNNKLVLGMWESKNLEIPNVEFQDYVMTEGFNLNNGRLNQQCLVQVNLQKAIKQILVSGENYKGDMSIETLYLDNEGEFVDELSGAEKKVFFLGDYEGIMNFKVDYTDDSVDIIQTYCAKDTYLVEQL
jgi:hypothetical protein